MTSSPGRASVRNTLGAGGPAIPRRVTGLTALVASRNVLPVGARESKPVPSRATWWALGWLGASLLAGACDVGIDTTRAPTRGTLGDDVYALLCDRLGASVLAEDLEGASFRGVCHLDEEGSYRDTVDATRLPPTPTLERAKARELSIAKLETLARRRAGIVRAIDAAIPDATIADPQTGAAVDLHDAMLRLTQALTALYDGNPFEPGGAPLMPATTEALGATVAGLEASPEALAALARTSGREGYLPATASLGALRALLTYPELRGVVRSLVGVLGPGGKGEGPLTALLTALEGEASTTRCALCDEPSLALDDAVTPNRPRATSEFLLALLADERDDFAGQGTSPWPLVRRDPRGFAVPKGNTPGEPGTVKAPFADGDGDGFADIDERGRFVDGGAAPLALDPPFAIPGQPHGPVDAQGKPTPLRYEYRDASRTLLAALARDLVPLLDPVTYAGGAPNAWETEHEAVMYALSGFPVLAGERVDAQYDHEKGTALAADAPCPSVKVPCTRYRRFAVENSPLPDLVHGLGQVLADTESDAVLQALEVLVRDHEDVVARLVDAGLRIKAIADAHDALAAQGKEPKAELPYTTPIWDEIAAILGKTADRPGLVAAVTKGLASDVLVSPAPQDPKIPDPTAQHLGETVAAFATMRDRYGYDPDDVNGVPLNLTDGGTSRKNPHNPVDRTAPLTGENRSMFERSLQLIHDSAGVKACNKKGAKLHTKIVDWPLVGSYDECKLFVFPNIAAFYLDSLLPPAHPKRAYLQVVANDVNQLMSFIGAFSSVDKLLETSSGVTGLTLHPSPLALNRLLFFGANSDRYGKLFDYDAKNASTDTAQFISGSIDAVASVVCPPNANGVPTCPAASPADVLRVRDYGTIFGWERLGFQGYLAPVVQAFASAGCNATQSQCTPTDYTGETLFLDTLDVLWRHWPDEDHGDLCESAVSPSDPRYCSGAGANHYEPIVAEAMLTDVIPALHDFAQVASQVDVVLERGPNAGKKVNGTAIVERLVRMLFSQEYAAEVGMVGRDGKPGTTWVDGTPQERVTVFSILADALHGMDERFAKSSLPDAAERKAKWRRARSLFVDRFLTIEGSGASARFANRAVPAMLLRALRLLREQTNAHCPKRETSGTCAWGRTELGRNAADFLAGPGFAGVVDLGDALASDEKARRELERMLGWMLGGEEDPAARASLVTGLVDLLQLGPVDRDWAPVVAAGAAALRSRTSPAGPGFVDRGLLVLDAVSRDAIDPHHALDAVLPLLVTPTDGGSGRAPLEVLLEAISAVNRYDAREEGGLSPVDVAFVAKTVREFFVSPTRGFAQLYAIVRNRRR